MCLKGNCNQLWTCTATEFVTITTTTPIKIEKKNEQKKLKKIVGKM